MQIQLYHAIFYLFLYLYPFSNYCVMVFLLLHCAISKPPSIKEGEQLISRFIRENARSWRYTRTLVCLMGGKYTLFMVVEHTHLSNSSSDIVVDGVRDRLCLSRTGHSGLVLRQAAHRLVNSRELHQRALGNGRLRNFIETCREKTKEKMAFLVQL